ncbi:flagellar filament capping protein FliD [Mesoterricola silvestris]|uniref:Flagellar hook-associated protein 2 n=1 Tax=Mesoterricola silvestris TaxID=2927979 RepID=A0AA48KAR9_9BACT|nr:flagellar filament capping protein FliD [Mesoterricola silvestris]BDU74976.1 flagellar hook-associated protein 2 [Mesoterricola silvestris]
MTSAISFQGLSTNLPTDQLIAAIINQQSQPMVRMQTQQAVNNTKSTALQTLSTDLTSLSIALDTLGTTGFQGNKVASSDSTGAYVTATASGAAPGQYDLIVKSLATRARLVMPTTMQPNAAIGMGDYTLTDMDGKAFTVTIGASNNSLSGLADAINNAKDANGTAINVNAAVIQTGADGSSQLVLSANNTGQGASGATTFSFTAPTGSTLGAGTSSSQAATNSDFILNGVELRRSSNSVSDAVQGVTFNLNQAQTDLTKTTTLTVTQDQDAATKAMQDVVDKFNTFYKDYKSKTNFTQNEDGSYTKGVFNMDMAVRQMVSQVSSALMGAPSGLPASATFTTAAGVGLKTNQDGTISLDTTAFKAALTKDPHAVSNIFANSATSTSPLLTFIGSGSATTKSPISYSVATVNGVLTGTFQNQKADGSTETNTLTSTNGYFYGLTGTSLEGLSVKASDGASGTLTVSTGISRLVQDLNSSLTSLTPGNIGGLMQDLSASNYTLSQQILQQQDYLARSKASLQKLYANLETTVGQLNAAGQSLSGM